MRSTRIAYFCAARLAGLVVPLSLGVAIMMVSPVEAGGELGNGTPEEFCESYANGALSDIDNAIRANCGFSGPRWTTDKEAHRKWCLSLNGNQKPAYDEYYARINAVHECGKSCNDYANEAAADAKKAIDLKCGFTGPRWSPEKDDHTIWCQFKGGRPYAKGETAARKAALEGCIRNHPNPAAPAHTQVVPMPAPKSSTGGAGSEPCDPPHVRYNNGTCGCPSGLTGANCDEIVLH